MKAHELASALNVLAKILRNGPNIDIEDLTDLSKIRRPVNNAPATATALGSLVAFSAFTKQQWAELIKAYDLPVEIRPTFSSRDVMGKIMNYFAGDEDARLSLLNKINHSPERVSPELMNALNILLRT